MFVSRIVVTDKMEVQFGRGSAVDDSQESKKLLIKYDRTDSMVGAAAKGALDPSVVRTHCIAGVPFLCYDGQKGNPC